MTVAFLGVFRWPQITIASVVYLFILSFIFWLIISVLALLPQHLVSRRFPSWIGAPFDFTVCYECIAVIAGSQVSSFTAIGNAVLDFEPLRQSASIFGLLGIQLVVLLCSSILAMTHLQKEFRPQRLRLAAVVATSFGSALISAGGYMVVSERFYQRNLVDLP